MERKCDMSTATGRVSVDMVRCVTMVDACTLSFDQRCVCTRPGLTADAACAPEFGYAHRRVPLAYHTKAGIQYRT